MINKHFQINDYSIIILVPIVTNNAYLKTITGQGNMIFLGTQQLEFKRPCTYSIDSNSTASYGDWKVSRFLIHIYSLMIHIIQLIDKRGQKIYSLDPFEKNNMFSNYMCFILFGNHLSSYSSSNYHYNKHQKPLTPTDASIAPHNTLGGCSNPLNYPMTLQNHIIVIICYRCDRFLFHAMLEDQ